MIDIPSMLIGMENSGGGGDITIEAISVTENGIYTAETGKAYSPVTVNVSGTPLLPSEYQEVEYIEADGNQYATHRGPAILNKQYIYAKTSYVDSPEYCILGIAQTQTSGGETSTSSNYFELYQQGGSYSTSGKADTVVYQYRNSSMQSNDRTLLPMEGIWRSSNDLFRYFWFCRYRSSGSAYYFIGKIYRIIVADEIVMATRTHDFIPCYRKSDSKPGLYDIINEEFYPSESEYPFVAGPDVNDGAYINTVESLLINKNGIYNAPAGKAYSPVTVNTNTIVEALSVDSNGTYVAPAGKSYSPVIVNVLESGTLPEEYQEVEYLTNDGYCWCNINTSGIQNYDKCEITISLSSDAASSENGVIGRTTGGTVAWEIYVENNSILFYGNIDGTTVSNISRDTKYTVTGNFSNQNYSTSFLWGRYRDTMYPFKGNMYSCRLYVERGSALLNLVKLVPCYRKSNNVPGFYDVVNSVFYTNQGSGTFGIGPVVQAT